MHPIQRLATQLCFIVVLLGGLAQNSQLTTARKLLDELLPKSYETGVRPGDENTATIVTVIPNKFILLAMDQQEETINISEEFLLSWVDPQLAWNPNVTAYTREWIKVPERNIWTPDIIFNSAIKREEVIPAEERMADLRFDGTVRESNPSVITSPCPLRINSFPYDVQICNLTIGPWNFGADEVVVKASTNSVLPTPGRFDGNSEWELRSIEAFEEIQVLQNETYSLLIYQIKLKRKPVYYVLVIQAPTFIMTSLTIFGIFTPFANTPERREKITLGLNMFVSISVMLNLVADMMPKASRLPLLGNYILSEIFVCSAALLVSIIILILHQRCHTRCIRPPKWLVSVLLCESSTTVAPETPASTYSITSNAPYTDILQKAELVEALEKASGKIRRTLNRLRKDDDVRLTWIRVFDRVDLICLIVFQLLNVVSSSLFMR
ncbi:hypothetical protein Q1695_014506 [Nippostrongylus brasiliensis]|nr:hypothetical protein Q1695_014506 [Nippostrongylus brasiliensis]